MEPLPSRRKPVHFPPIDKFNAPVIIFLTVCTQSRKRILAKQDVHQLLVEAWAHTTQWRVGHYVIMPDHVHLFCAPSDIDHEPLSKWVQYWKSYSSKRWPRPQEQPVWQKSFWDTQLRDGERYEEKWEYVRANPVRAGLVSRVEEWEYCGEVYRFEW